MSFLTFTWLGWIWGTVGLYWLAPRAARRWVLMALSLVFLVYTAPLSAGLLVGAWALTAYFAAQREVTRAALFMAGGTLALGLIVFKLNLAAETDSFFENVAIPLGMSYYVFRCLHVLLERFKGSFAPVDPVDLASYLFFMPTFVVGPIHRLDTFLRDQKRQRFDPVLMRDGFERILIGFFKIVVLSNLVAQGIIGGALQTLEADQAWLAAYLLMVRDGLNIYLQFSGHCDVAIGFAYLLGYRVMENFNWPYLKHNISEFWKSWHISLSRWCRDYLYGVVVAKSRSPALGAAATMVLIGLWHEISLRYLAWAAWHVVGIVIWQMWRDWRGQSREAELTSGGVAHVASVVLTVHFVWFSFVILTTPDLADVGARMVMILTGVAL